MNELVVAAWHWNAVEADQTPGERVLKWQASRRPAATAVLLDRAVRSAIRYVAEIEGDLNAGKAGGRYRFEGRIVAVAPIGQDRDALSAAISLERMSTRRGQPSKGGEAAGRRPTDLRPRVFRPSYR